MRIRPWLMLAGLVAIAAVTALPAAAQGSGPGFDQVQIIEEVSDKLAPPRDRTMGWLDIGVSLPVTRFKDRDWDPGLFLRWNQEVWASGGASVVGSFGLAFNNESNFNEGQIDSAFAAGFDDLAFVQVLSHNHVGIPLAVELQLEPARRSGWSPFIAAGPAIQYTFETRTRQQYYQISYTNFVPFAVPFNNYSEGTDVPALIADRQLKKTHFHLGYQARAGFRVQVGPSDNPIALRLTGSLNTWFEHDRPLTVVGGMISFGR